MDLGSIMGQSGTAILRDTATKAVIGRKSLPVALLPQDRNIVGEESGPGRLSKGFHYLCMCVCVWGGLAPQASSLNQNPESQSLYI